MSVEDTGAESNKVWLNGRALIVLTLMCAVLSLVSAILFEFQIKDDAMMGMAVAYAICSLISFGMLAWVRKDEKD